MSNSASRFFKKPYPPRIKGGEEEVQAHAARNACTTQELELHLTRATALVAAAAADQAATLQAYGDEQACKLKGEELVEWVQKQKQIFEAIFKLQEEKTKQTAKEEIKKSKIPTGQLLPWKQKRFLISILTRPLKNRKTKSKVSKKTLRF